MTIGDEKVVASAATTPPSAPVGVEGLMQLARNWCLAWGEWAHDADPGCAKENAAEAALRAALTTALAQQPAAVECPHRTRCDCLAACKYGFAGDGALAAQPGGSDHE